MKNFALFFLLLLSACAGVPDQTPEDKSLRLQASSFSALPSWGADDFKGLTQAMTRTCGRIEKKEPALAFGPDARWGTFGDWQDLCADYAQMAATKEAQQKFFETHFAPYVVSAGDDPEGLFTGYFEASLRGSRTQHGPYQIPLRARPDDLVMVDLGAFRDSLKGQRIAGRVVGGNLKPYETHAQINDGKLPQNDVLVWVDSAVDKFFLQIQGSGIVALDDGSVMRVGYAGQNGHVYTAIGKTLIERGALEKGKVSMQAIKDWLAAHPDDARDVMESNESYVFFRTLDGEGPIGGAGVALTPLRSLAVDRSLLPYGALLWLETDTPRLSRLMVAQDTGGAIRGPVRGDVFWGHGEKAEAMAGPMQAKGRYWTLLPRKMQ